MNAAIIYSGWFFDTNQQTKVNKLDVSVHSTQHGFCYKLMTTYSVSTCKNHPANVSNHSVLILSQGRGRGEEPGQQQWVTHLAVEQQRGRKDGLSPERKYAITAGNYWMRKKSFSNEMMGSKNVNYRK